MFIARFSTIGQNHTTRDAKTPRELGIFESRDRDVQPIKNPNELIRHLGHYGRHQLLYVFCPHFSRLQDLRMVCMRLGISIAQDGNVGDQRQPQDAQARVASNGHLVDRAHADRIAANLKEKCRIKYVPRAEAK